MLTDALNGIFTQCLVGLYDASCFPYSIPIVETVNSENNEITKRHNKKKAFTNETQNSGSDVSLE